MSKSYYPPISLKNSMVIAKTIYEKNAGNPIFKVTLAEELDYKSEARGFRDLITSSNGYGLTNGSYASQKISLEEQGVAIAQGNPSAIYDALFSQVTFKKFYDNFGSRGSKGIPAEKAARDFIKTDCGVPDTQTKMVFENIIQDAKDWFLIQDIAGGEKFVHVDLALSKYSELFGNHEQDDLINENFDGETEQRDGKPNESSNNKATVNFSPNLQLNIQIHIDANTSEEKIEVLFKNMRKYLIDNDR